METQTKETYFAVVMANALQVSSNGTESVAIQFQATKNLSKDCECDLRFVGNLYLSARAVENSIKTLQDVFGYTEQSFFPLNDPNTLQGKDCEITVAYEEYEGKVRPKVQWFNKSGSFANRSIKPVGDAVARDISSRLDAYFALVQNGTAAPNTAKQTQPKTQSKSGDKLFDESQDDDLPF